jgi:hypothetical protein
LLPQNKKNVKSDSGSRSFVLMALQQSKC